MVGPTNERSVVNPAPTMPQMVDSLAIESLELIDRAPAPGEDAASASFTRAALDFAWGRIDRPWADDLARALADGLPDVFADALERCGAGADRLDAYAAAARLLLELEERLVRDTTPTAG